MISLYYAHPACSMASHIALEESGLAFEAVPVNLGDAAERAKLTRLNPKNKIPTLVIDDQVLTENVAIMWHIAELAPAAKLLPDNPLDRAQCLSMLSWYASTVHIAFRQSWRPEKFANDPSEAAIASIRANGRETFWAALQTLDKHLENSKFVIGEQFSLADTYPMVFYNWALIAEYPVENLPHLSAYKDRIIARPCVRKVLDREGCKLLG